MREDNSDKRMFYKYIFLLAVTLLIGLVYLWKWTADNPKKQGPEEMFQQEEQVESSNKTKEIDKEKLEQGLTDEAINHEKMSKGESQEQHNTEEVSLEKTYIKQHGEKETIQAKEQAKTVLALYLLQVTEWDKWDGTVTDKYIKSVQKEMSQSKQESVKREINENKLYYYLTQNNI